MLKETYIDDDYNKLFYTHLPYLERKQQENDFQLKEYEIDPRIKKIGQVVERDYNDRKLFESTMQKNSLRQQELDLLKRTQFEAIDQLNKELFGKLELTQTQKLTTQTQKYTPQFQSFQTAQSYHPIKKMEQQNNQDLPRQQYNTQNQQFEEDFIKSQPTRNVIHNQINPNYTAQQQVESSSSKYWKNQTQFVDNKPNEKVSKSSHDCGICRDKLNRKMNHQQNQKRETLDINKILLRSKILIEQNKMNDAESFMKKFIDMEIYEHSDLYYLYGDVLRQLSRYQEAEHYLLEALEFKIYSPQCLVCLGQCYMSMDLYTRSIVLFKKALGFQDTATINHLLALSLLQNKQYLEAAIHLTRSIELDEFNYTIYLERGTVYQKLGFEELASNDFSVYKQLNLGWQSDLEQQILDYEQLGDFELSQQLKQLIQQIRDI